MTFEGRIFHGTRPTLACSLGLIQFPSIHYIHILNQFIFFFGFSSFAPWRKLTFIPTWSKAQRHLYTWIFKHDRFVLGARFTALEDPPRCVLRRSRLIEDLTPRGLLYMRFPSKSKYSTSLPPFWKRQQRACKANNISLYFSLLLCCSRINLDYPTEMQLSMLGWLTGKTVFFRDRFYQSHWSLCLFHHKAWCKALLKRKHKSWQVSSLCLLVCFVWLPTYD